MEQIEVNSPNVKYTEQFIESQYIYNTTRAERKDGKVWVTPCETNYTFR